MNYAGDLQAGSLTFSQANLCVGVGLNYQIKHLSVNADIVAGSVEANDKYGSNSIRNLNFKSNITEGSVSLQYDVIDISDTKKITPYVFAGIGVAHFNPYTYDVTGKKTYLQPLGTEGQDLPQYPNRKLYSLFEFCVPLGIGIKYKINDRFTVGVEYNTRFLNTDYLDDVSRTYPNRQALLDARGINAVQLSFRTPEIDPSAIYTDDEQRGNPREKDNFYSAVFKLSYTIPQGNQDGTRRIKSGNMRCPRKVY